MASVQPIVTCLWFDHQAEEAARFYTSIFPNSRIGKTAPYGEAGKEIHGKKPGTVMTIEFELNGVPFTGLNGGPIFRFTEAISFQVMCETQAEVDHYWSLLGEGGDPSAQQCGWLKDKFGVSSQIVPKVLGDLVAGPDTAKSQRAMQAMLQMKKLDIEALRQAYAG